MASQQLYKFLGLKPPESSKKRTSEDIKVSNKMYDANKRKRTIVPSWKSEFAWLVTDDTHPDGGKIFCKSCRSVYAPLVNRKQPDRFRKYANGPFVAGGSGNLRHDSLSTHDTSEGHRYAEQYLAAKACPPGQTEAEKSIQALNKVTFDKLSTLFQSVHAVAKKSRPLSDFVWQCELDEKKGLDLGSTYKNSHSAKEFLVAIAEVERDVIESKLAQANFITLMSDGSTDISVSENEIVYVHFAIEGATHCYFMGLISCPNAGANGIYDAIMLALNCKQITLTDVQKRVVAFAGDGASVNTGHINGVIALLRRRIRNSIVMVQCMSHRIELAYKEILGKSSLYKKAYSLMDELYKFYHKSAKQSAGLKVAFNALDMPNATPTRVGGTRWLGHTLTALNVIWKGYKAFVLHLSEVNIN